jgi:prolyl-tRNA synthetase
VHFTGSNWGRDLREPMVADIRNVTNGDPSPDGQGSLSIARGIEVGHIFQLGDRYSEALRAEVLDEEGASTTMVMGCYGIGVSRVVAAAIEQNHDDRGIIWPASMAPFQISLVPIGLGRSQRVGEVCEALYRELTDEGYSLLFDDRDQRPGVMFADHDLIGIPYRIVVGDRGLGKGEVEFKVRGESESRMVPLSDLPVLLRELIPAV